MNNNFAPTFFIFALTFCLALVSARATTDKGEMLFDKYLPASSVHHFSKIDPSWRSEVKYWVHPFPRRFYEGADSEIEEYKSLPRYKEIRYFDKTNKHRPVKIVFYDPHENIRSELDQRVSGKVVKEQFIRSFYPDAQLQDYEHWRNFRTISEISIAPDTGQVEIVKNGKGRLTTYDPEGKVIERKWLFAGKYFASEDFNSKGLTEITLYTKPVVLTVNKDTQELYNWTRNEEWIISSNGALRFRKISLQPESGYPISAKVEKRKKDQIGKNPFPTDDPLDPTSLVTGNRTKIFAKRKSDFFRHFNLILKEAGVTAKDLGIEFIKNGKPWPAAHSEGQGVERLTAKAVSSSTLEKTTKENKPQDIDYGPYMAEVQRRIKASWQPPKGDDTRQVVVVFKIYKFGELSDLHLDKSSGVATQDKAALAAVEKAAPFQPLPTGASAPIDIQFTFDYIVGGWQSVVEDETKSINVNSKNALAYRHRGNAYCWLGQYQKAIDDCKKAVNLNPKDALSYKVRGLAYGYIEQHQKALIDLNKAISLDPKNASAFNDLGNCYQALSEFKKAITNYKKALALDPNNSEAAYDWGACQLNLGENKQSIIDINRFIDHAPNNGSAYYVRGLLYDAECSEKWKAIADFNKALMLTPSLWRVYTKRAAVFSELGRHDYAAADFTMAIKHSSEDAVLYAKRGAEYAELGEYQLAIEDFKKAFKLDPIDAGYDGFYAYLISGGYGFYPDYFSQDNGRYFFINKSGKRITNRIFKNARGFSEGLAAVKVGKDYGYIDKSCRFIFKPQFSDARDFHEGLALTAPANSQDWGYITKSGKLAINDHNYPSSGMFFFKGSGDHFSEGLAPVFIGDKYGFINKCGEVVIPPLFEVARPFSEGLAVVEMAGRYGFIDKTGKLVIEPQFDLVGDFSEGLAPILQLRKSRFVKRPPTDKKGFPLWQSANDYILDDCKYGFIDKNGKYVIEPRFKVPLELSYNISQSLRRSFNRTGQQVDETHLQSSSFSSNVGFSEGMASVCVAGKYGFVDTNGTMVIQPQFEWAQAFCEGLAPVCIDSRYGFIDKTGKFVIKPQFDSAQQFSEGFAVVEMQNSKKKTKK